jgi:aspartyl protease family protein
MTKKILVFLAVLCLQCWQELAAETAPAQQTCRVADPTGTPLNVRLSPNGPISRTLSNGTIIFVLNTAVNNGEHWIYVAHDGVPIGWVFRNYVDCQSPTVTTSIAPGTSSSGTSIPLKNEGGGYVVPVLINNAITLDFVVDSGAADVTIPADVVSTLIRKGTIDKSDFIGTQKYQLADGSIVPSLRFRIRSLKIGDKVLENVVGSLAPSEGQLLLGQSFLKYFKSWSIDNTTHTLMLNE